MDRVIGNDSTSNPSILIDGNSPINSNYRDPTDNPACSQDNLDDNPAPSDSISNIVQDDTTSEDLGSQFNVGRKLKKRKKVDKDGTIKSLLQDMKEDREERKSQNERQLAIQEKASEQNDKLVMIMQRTLVMMISKK